MTTNFVLCFENVDIQSKETKPPIRDYWFRIIYYYYYY